MPVEARAEAPRRRSILITMTYLLPSLFDMLRTFSVVAASSLLNSCATYTPMPQTTPAAKETIRLTLTEASQTESVGHLGSRVRTVEGQVRSADDSSITLAVNEVSRTASDNERVQGELVTIPRRNVSAMDL